MKRIAAICLSLFVGLVSFTAAQEISKPINGGVLNGKAISLPKPPYPPAARAVGASGAVTVQILIDENGDVISATAISGHPLLRAAAAEAARNAKFSPTLLSGTPVKVAGVVTYNFVGPLHLARISFILSNAERTSLFGNYSAPESLASQLPSDWVQEKEILRSLTFEETPKIAARVDENPPAAKPDNAVSAPPPPRDTNRYTIKGDSNFSVAGTTYGAQKLDTKSAASVQNLANLVEARASVNTSTAWTYELGRTLGVLVADIEDRAKFQSALDSLESLSQRAPLGILEHSLQQLKEFVELVKKENPGNENRQSIRASAEMLSSLRY